MGCQCVLTELRLASHARWTARGEPSSCDSGSCRFRVRISQTPNLVTIQRSKMLAQCAAVVKRFVYVLKNAEIPSRYYTGVTSDVAKRLVEHNAGSCTHTAKYRPWSVDVVIEFSDEWRAVAFERYLKSGSGVAFATRHLR